MLADYYDEYMPSTVSGSTLADTLAVLGSVDYDTPATINIYAETFEDKELIDNLIADYNAAINAVSYGLIGFVSIALVVSSIMIGIITYISVLERTKEIGILRSVGASKKDASRVFNAETIIVGFMTGLIGIGVTLLLNIPISIIAERLTGISGIALALLVWLVVIFFDKQLFLLFGANETLLPLARSYIAPIKFVLPVFLFSQFLSAFLRNDGDPGLAAKAVLCGGIFNVFGGLLFYLHP